jgi:exopolysaccharide production protein ExoZ
MPLFFGGFLAAIMVGACLEMERTIGARIPAILLLIGDASYSLYLTHWFLVSVFRTLILHFPATLSFGAALPLFSMVVLCCIVGILTYHFVESPINHYFRVRRRTATAA